MIIYLHAFDVIFRSHDPVPFFFSSGLALDTVYTGSSCVLSNVDPSGTSRHLDTPLALAWASKHSPELLITRVPLLPLDA